MSELFAAVVGALLAVLVDRVVVARLQDAETARGLCIAFWEELSAVEFSRLPNLGAGIRRQATEFAGFSSQTFDTLFGELAGTLPSSLARALMGYHWRMKFLGELRAQGHNLGSRLNMLDEAEELHSALLKRLDAYSRRGKLAIALKPEEAATETRAPIIEAPQ